MSIMDGLRARAMQNTKRIVLPEGNEKRNVMAAIKIFELGYAIPVLIGKRSVAEELAEGGDLSKLEVIDPETSSNFETYCNMLYEMRKAKGMTIEQAKDTMKDPLYYGAMMLKNGEVDGMVAGAINATGDVLRPAFHLIKTAPGISIVSSSFIMEMPDTGAYAKQVMLFADCAININPNADELAAIALATADTAKAFGVDPRVAMLSFSTKGSAKHEFVDKVVEATKKVKESAPDLMVDGELQADAAIVESVGKLKSPDSQMAGKANVLVFPDLQAGNIGYKLVQRIGGASAIGPICQGMAKPVNDLSRGCSVDDIVDVVTITAIQAENNN